MKKTGIRLKVILVVALAVILIALSVGTPTFSWFDRPKTSSAGRYMDYNIADTGSTDTNSPLYGLTDSNNKQGLYSYDGSGVTITSNQFSADGSTYTDEGQVAAYQGVTANRSLVPGARDFYKTTLTNNSSYDQNVSLYISNLRTTNTSGELCVGVNSPVKAYKNYSLMASSNNVNTATMVPYADTSTVRVYFTPKYAWYNQGWASDTVEIQYSSSNFEDTSSGTFADMTYIGRKYDSGAGSDIWFYYYDVPVGTKCIRFHVKGKSDAWSWTGIKSGITLTAKQSKLFWATSNGGTDNGYGQVAIDYSDVSGPYWNNKLSDATKVYMRTTMDLSYVKDTHYIGSSATYRATNSTGSAEDTSKFTVNASTGVVTPKAVGSAYLEVTIKGSTYGDTKVVRTKVTVASLVTGQVNVEDAPIITNLLIPAGEEVNVRWFIMNDKNASANATYRMDGVYIGL